MLHLGVSRSREQLVDENAASLPDGRTDTRHSASHGIGFAPAVTCCEQTVRESNTLSTASSETTECDMTLQKSTLDGHQKTTGRINVQRIKRPPEQRRLED